LTNFAIYKDIFQIDVEGYPRERIDKTLVPRYPIGRYLLDRYLRKGKIKVIEMKKDPWISANDAAEIISGNSGRPVHPDYVRLLARQNPKKLASKPLDGRTNVYLRTDVEKIQVKAKRVAHRSVEATQAPVQPIEAQPVEEKPILAITQTEVAQICVSDTKKGLPDNLPTGTLKRGAFVQAYGLSNADFGKWLENGLGDDHLEVTYYTNEKNKKSSYLTPSQQKQVLEILKRHDKLKMPETEQEVKQEPAWYLPDQKS
jgi:hypothetical protein